ncbi:MAG: hypothetical protein ACYCYM_07880 [Saccharofermentanales bacterium]
MRLKLHIAIIFLAITMTAGSCKTPAESSGNGMSSKQDSSLPVSGSIDVDHYSETGTSGIPGVPETSSPSSIETASSWQASSAAESPDLSPSAAPTKNAPSVIPSPAIVPTKIPASDDMLFLGFYHVDTLLNQDVFEQLLDSSYTNCFVLSRGYYSRADIARGAKKVKEHDKYAWLSVSEAIFDFYEDRTEIRTGWKSQIDEIIQLIKDEDALDSILGFYFDEPYLWRITPAELREVTMYLQIRYQKRVFVCFSIGAVAPSVWNDPSRIKSQIDYYAGQYITDVAYDMYSTYDPLQYKKIADEMKERMGNRSDLKIWYIPCTMNYLGNKTQQYAIDHLDGMYYLLKQEENPGGLMCFTYYTFPGEVENLGNVGLDRLLNPSNNPYWTELGSRIQTIGNEICR